MDVNILPATLADIDSLLPLVTAYRTFYERPADTQREREFMTERLENRSSALFIARDCDDRIVGFAQLFQTWSTVWLGPSLIFEDLFVVPDARRSGVATKLLERAVAYALEIGAVGMFLETAMDNATAQAAYERAGWTREQRFYKYNATL